MENDAFLRRLISLAPEGETMLLTRQSPVLQDGQLQFYANGAIKATFPAFLPNTKKRKPGEAWFGNTASYLLDRMKDRISAAAANCTHVLVMMLDDVGTKSKTPELPPSWIMETSPNNWQWGYIFSEQPTKGEFAAAIRVIADAGYTDPGAINPVRNFRLPGSVNLKPGNKLFEAKLVEFHPNRCYTLDEICAALGVTPGPEEDSNYRAVKLTDDGGDDIVKWLSEQGLVYSKPNAEGWMGVHCPQADQHTDGSPEGRYKPSERAFCCLHSHCVDLGSNEFLEWVHKKNGPLRKPGLRDELVQASLAKSIGMIEPTQELDDAAKEILARVNQRQAERVEKDNWFKRFAYLQRDDAYFDLQNRDEISRASFNALFRHTRCNSRHLNAQGVGRRIEASVWYDEKRQDKGGQVLQGVTYAPGEDSPYERAGAVFGNKWANLRPGGVQGDISPWLELAEKLIPDEYERKHVFDVMAFKVQHPEGKINHAVLHGGTQGCGKDTLWAAMQWAIDKRTDVNAKTIKNEQLTSQWGYHYEAEMVVVQELRQSEARDRRELENMLKPIIAAPPETITINRKGLAPYSALNRVFVLAFTNQTGAIAIDSHDRRWFVIWSPAPRMTAGEGKKFWDWYKGNDDMGFKAVTAWLHARDVSQFNPGAAPPATDAKSGMIESARSIPETFLLDEILSQGDGFQGGVILAPFHRLLDSLQGRAPNCKLYLGALYHALNEAGWLDMGMTHSPAYQTKKRLFCAPQLAAMSKAELRRIGEEAAAGRPGLAGLPAAESLRRVK